MLIALKDYRLDNCYQYFKNIRDKMEDEAKNTIIYHWKKHMKS